MWRLLAPFIAAPLILYAVAKPDLSVGIVSLLFVLGVYTTASLVSIFLISRDDRLGSAILGIRSKQIDETFQKTYKESKYVIYLSSAVFGVVLSGALVISFEWWLPSYRMVPYWTTGFLAAAFFCGIIAAPGSITLLVYFSRLR